MKKAKYFSRFVIRVVVLSLVIVGVGWFGEKETKIVQAQTYQYTITPEHPKLFLTPQRLQEIKDWINGPNPPSEWQGILSRATQTVGVDFDGGGPYSHTTLINAFIYMINGDETYGRRAVNMMLTKIDDWDKDYTEWWSTPNWESKTVKDGVRPSYLGPDSFPGPWVQDQISFGYAPTYDWTSELMTDEERNRIIEVMNKLIYGPVGRWEYGYDAGSFGTSDYYFPHDPNGNIVILKPPTGSSDSPVTVTGKPISYLDINWYVAMWAAEGMWGMVSYPENPEAKRFIDTTILTYENVGEDFYNQYAKGGGLWEGSWYSRVIFTPMSYTFLAFKDVLGEQFYNQLISNNPWIIDGRIYFEIFSTFPWKGEWVSVWNVQRHQMRYSMGHDFDDPPGTRTANTAWRDHAYIWMLSRMASPEAKKHAYWYLNRLPAMTYSGEYVYKLLFYDPEVVPEEPSLSVAPYYYSPGMGYVFTRSDWTDNATWLGFSAGTALRHYGSGSELGRFDIAKHTLLTGDNLHYEYATAGYTPHWWMFYNHKLPVYNNCLLVGDINTVCDGDSWRYSYRYGGQISWFPPRAIGEINPGQGEFKALENTNEYTYIFANLKKAYVLSMVERFDREIVFVRPDYIFVFDRVTTAQPAIKKRFAAQFRNEPTIAGDITTATNRLYVDTDPRSDEAKLFVKTLLPEDYTITKVGPGWNSEAGPEDGNSWRFEVESQTGTSNKDGLFLHAFYPTLATTQAMPATTRIDAVGGNMVGAQMQDPQTGRENIVMFSKTETTSTGGLAEPITYNVSGQGTSKHLIVDLKPNTQFTITNRNIDTDTVVDTKTQASSTQGTLYFETILGSNHRISITPGGQIIKGDVNGDGLVNVVDVQLAVNQFLGVLPQTQEADLNGDGVVNVIDVQQLVNIILGG